MELLCAKHPQPRGREEETLCEEAGSMPEGCGEVFRCSSGALCNHSQSVQVVGHAGDFGHHVHLLHLAQHGT